MSSTHSSYTRKQCKIYGHLRLYNHHIEDWDHVRSPEIGDLKYSVATNDHYNWLICNGRSLSRTDYPDLFNLIGTTYGSNDINTFKIPDTRGRVIGSIGSGTGLTTRSSGELIGEETHTMTSNEMPTHSHTGTTSSDGAHTHSITDPGHTHTQTTINDDYNNSGENPPGFTADSAGSQTWSNINSSTTGITINSSGAHTHTFTTNTSGSGLAFNVMQPTIFLGNCFIYTKNDRTG